MLKAFPRICCRQSLQATQKFSSNDYARLRPLSLMSMTTKTYFSTSSASAASSDSVQIEHINDDVETPLLRFSLKRKKSIKSPISDTFTNALHNQHKSPTGQQKQRLVILGSGWAGYRLLQEIDSINKYSVCLISPRNHFLFTPLLASAALGQSSIGSVCQPIRPLTARKKGVFLEAKASFVDKDEQIVYCEEVTQGSNNNSASDINSSTVTSKPFPIPYDKLIIATGFQANDFGIPNLEKHAFFMKETGDAQKVHEHILNKFEEASLIHLLDGDEMVNIEEEKQIRKCLSFVIVGGGPTGVELCGELTDFLHSELKRNYPHLTGYWSVKLIDALPSLLTPFQNEELQEHAKKHLVEKQGVDVLLNEFVDKVSEGNITLKSGKSFDFSTLLWCAGIKPLAFVRDLDVAKCSKNRQILTDNTLRVKNETNIYALGDCSTIENYPLPQTAQIANQQAKYLAKELNSESQEKNFSRNFQHYDGGVMAFLGGLSAVFRAPSFFTIYGFQLFPNLKGLPAWLTWRSAYWSMQLSNRNRFQLAVDWFSNWVFGRDLHIVGEGSRPVEREEELIRKKSFIKKTKSYLRKSLSGSGSGGPIGNSNLNMKGNNKASSSLAKTTSEA